MRERTTPLVAGTVDGAFRLVDPKRANGGRPRRTGLGGAGDGCVSSLDKFSILVGLGEPSDEHDGIHGDVLRAPQVTCLHCRLGFFLNAVVVDMDVSHCSFL